MTRPAQAVKVSLDEEGRKCEKEVWLQRARSVECPVEEEEDEVETECDHVRTDEERGIARCEGFGCFLEVGVNSLILFFDCETVAERNSIYLSHGGGTCSDRGTV